MRSKHTEAIFFLVVLFLSMPYISSGQTNTAWQVVSEVQGKVTSMSKSFFGVHTYFNIEKEIILQIDYEGNPIRGEIKFVNGHQREMQQPEAVFYWDEFGGAQALWNYLQSKDRIISIDPKTGEIPPEAWGRQSRLISVDAKEYFGKIRSVPSSSAWFTIEIEGWSLYVYKKNVQAIQQMK